jgi:hypothetical protein
MTAQRRAHEPGQARAPPGRDRGRIKAVRPFGLDLTWADDAELRLLKELFWRPADEGGEPSDAEQVRAFATYANATARMIEGARP